MTVLLAMGKKKKEGEINEGGTSDGRSNHCPRSFFNVADSTPKISVRLGQAEEGLGSLDAAHKAHPSL